MHKRLKHLTAVGLMAGMAISLHTAATAQTLPTVPTADVSVNGVSLDISNLFVQIGKFYVIPTQVVTVGGNSVTIGITGNPDPSLTYSFAASNPFGSAIPFAFDSAIPLSSPVTAGSPIITSIGYSLTDSSAGDGVTLTPSNTLSQHATGDGTDLGINVGPAFTGSGSGPLHTYSTDFSGSGTAPFTFSVLDVHLAFTLSGGGDTAGISGAVGVASVPEPGTVALLTGLGISGSAFLLRRKRRVSRRS